MCAFFFRKKEIPQTEVPGARLERTTNRIIENLEQMTFGPDTNLTGLKVRKLPSPHTNETLLELTGMIPNNLIGLGPLHLEPIVAQLNQELAEDARPFTVTVDTFISSPTTYGDDAVTDTSSYVLKITEQPIGDIRSGGNVIHVPFDRR
jgi:hypothetical protein